MITIQASEFRTRSDLEKHAKLLEGQEAVIVGEERVLKNLQLSATTKVWGIKCEVLPETKKKLGSVKVRRGLQAKKKRIIKSKKK